MTIFHVDLYNGNDANDGLAEGTPKRTPSALTLADGDTIRIKAGGVWATPAAWGAQNVADVLVTTYGDGPKPIIRNGFDRDVETSTVQVENRARWTFEDIHFVRDRPSIYRGRAPLELRGSSSVGGHIIRRCDFEGGGDTFRIIQRVPGVQVIDCTFEGAYTDAFWASCGDGLWLQGCSMYGYGVGDANGDGIQLSDCVGAARIRDNEVVMPLISVKQAIFCQSTDVSAIVYLEDNRVHNPGSSTSAVISIEGQGVIERNIATGNINRAFQITSRTAGHTVCRIANNLGVSGLDAPEYGATIAGAHVKDVRLYHNTLIGRWARAVFIGVGATPSGSTYDGGNNAIDCMNRSGSRAFWNDGALAFASRNDNVWRTEVMTQNAVTLAGLTQLDPCLDPLTHRPLAESPLIGAGFYFAQMKALGGHRRPRQPTVGAHEYVRPRQIRV